MCYGTPFLVHVNLFGVSLGPEYSELAGEKTSCERRRFVASNFGRSPSEVTRRRDAGWYLHHPSVRFPAHPLPPQEKSDGGNARAVDRAIDRILPRRSRPFLIRRGKQQRESVVRHDAARPATAKGNSRFRRADSVQLDIADWRSGALLPGLLKFVNMKSRRLSAFGGV